MRSAAEEGIGARAVRALGTGFDLTSDFRLKFAKGYPGGVRLVELSTGGDREVVVSGEVIRGVPPDVRCDKGERTRFKSDVLEFNQMSELLNQKSSVQGKIPSGYFNALFELSGVWLQDAMDTKYLAFDGYFISLYNLHLTTSPLILRNEVKKAVPSKWEPVALSRFIKAFGTHIMVGVSIGAQDVICIRQKHSSTIPSTDLKLHLEDLGDYLFSDGKSLSPLHRKTGEGKQKVPEVFQKILKSNNLQLASHTETSDKDGLTIICSKRGGETYSSSHSKWLQTVPFKPDAIHFKFVPITSLLTGVPGSGFLSHAINLYLRYKPAPDDLQYFLEFQVPQQWGPMFNELALGPHRRKVPYPTLQFSFLGPKLQINISQVTTGRKPVTGLRLFLEGKKCNRLAIHVQHLSSIPSMLEQAWASSAGSSPPCQWRGNEDSDPKFLEPIHWKKYSHVCTAPVKHDPLWLQTSPGGVFVVTGVQLIAKGKWTKKSLHLRVLYTYVPGCSIRQSHWAWAPAASHKSSLMAMLSTTFTQRENPAAQKPQEAPNLNSGVYHDGPPVPVQSRKLLKFVDVTEVVRGPHDVPGHWLVTAAKLVKEGRKIGLHVKFSLLDYPAATNDKFLG